MNPHAFLDVADDLAVGWREGDWRSAVSRAYYAAFHVARALLRRGGFVVPQGDQAHAYLWLRLSATTAVLARVVDAIKVYERDVLRQVTWLP